MYIHLSLTHTHTHTHTLNGITTVFLFHSAVGCCIYAKPHKFGESDTESDSDGDDDCCHEHRVARRRVPHKHPQPENTEPSSDK